MARVDNINIDGTPYPIGGIASTTNLGMVKIGNGLSINAEGVLSAGTTSLTHLTITNAGTVFWDLEGTSNAAAMDLEDGQIRAIFSSGGVIFQKDDETTMNVQELFEAIEDGEQFEIDIPFETIATRAMSAWDYHANAGTVERVPFICQKSVIQYDTGDGVETTTSYNSSVAALTVQPYNGYVLYQIPFGIAKIEYEDEPDGYKFYVTTFGNDHLV